MRTRNPTISRQPDLFGPRGGLRLTKQHVRLADLTEDQIRALPRLAFSDEEWEEIEEETREWIYDHDPDSQARIEGLSEVFVRAWDWAHHPDTYADYGYVEGSFEAWLSEHAGEEDLVDQVDSDQVNDLYADYPHVHRETFRQAMNSALSDLNAWDHDVVEDTREERRQHDWYVPVGESQPSVPGDEIGGFLEIAQPDMRRDEIDRAGVLVADATNQDIDFDANQIDRLRPPEPARHRARAYWGDFYFRTEPNLLHVMDVDWDRVRDNLASELAEYERVEAEEVEAAPPEERVVYRFDDGSYVQRLTAAELPDEGRKMGMCVGRADMGYLSAVRRGVTAILSLRTKAGRPKFTFEVEMRRGEPTHIIQIKGKANRLPGWDLGKAGSGEMKLDEVQKVVEFVRSYGFDPDNIMDLQPAMERLRQLPPKQNPRRRARVHCGFCCPPGPHPDK